MVICFFALTSPWFFIIDDIQQMEIISIPFDIYYIINCYLPNYRPHILPEKVILRISNISVNKNCPEIASLHAWQTGVTKETESILKWDFCGNELMRKTSELSRITIVIPINHLLWVKYTTSTSDSRLCLIFKTYQ